MPAGDKTGPMGTGPRTGRQLGYCSGNDAPGFESGFGLGRGRRKFSGQGRGRGGRGFGFGRGRGNNASNS